jgi:hypothetical protein
VANPPKPPAFDVQRDGTVYDMGEALRLGYLLLQCLINLQESGKPQAGTITVCGRMYEIKGQTGPYRILIKPSDN